MRESQPPPKSEDYPPPDESEDFWDEAMEAEWWRRRIRNTRQERQLPERHDAFIGPRMPPLSPAARAQLSRALRAELPCRQGKTAWPICGPGTVSWSQA